MTLSSIPADANRNQAFWANPIKQVSIPCFPLATPNAVASLIGKENERLEKSGQSAVRWPISAMPLRVCILNTPLETQTHIFTLIRQWEVASVMTGAAVFEPLIRFTPCTCGVSNHNVEANHTAVEPHITLRWEKQTVLGRDDEVGHAHRQVDAQGLIQQVEITLIFDPAIDRRLSPAMKQVRFEATILHEFGHALGLEHSDYSGDIMHHRGWRNVSLSDHDATRLQQLYRRPSGLLS